MSLEVFRFANLNWWTLLVSSRTETVFSKYNWIRGICNCILLDLGWCLTWKLLKNFTHCDSSVCFALQGSSIYSYFYIYELSCCFNSIKSVLKPSQHSFPFWLLLHNIEELSKLPLFLSFVKIGLWLIKIELSYDTILNFGKFSIFLLRSSIVLHFHILRSTWIYIFKTTEYQVFKFIWRSYTFHRRFLYLII